MESLCCGFILAISGTEYGQELRRRHQKRVIHGKCPAKSPSPTDKVSQFIIGCKMSNLIFRERF